MRPTAVRRYLRFLALAAGAAALLAALGWLPTRNLAGEAGGAALLAACAVCWMASALGGVPVLLAEAEREPGDGPGHPPPAVTFGSMLVRLAAVAGLALAVTLSGLVARTPFLVWTALGYLALLVVDTRYALGGGATRGTRANETKAGRDGGTSGTRGHTERP